MFNHSNDSVLTFEEFRATWIDEAGIKEGLLSTAKGRRFAVKLLRDWLDVDEASTASDNFFDCDGACDGGIDVAYLQNENTDGGDTWYIVQSKYGNAFKGSALLLAEARKILDTLDCNSKNRSKRVSTLTLEVIERLEQFYCEANLERDKIILLFATDDDLSESEKQTVNDIRSIGRERLGQMFDVRSISIRTIYQNQTQKDADKNVCVRLRMPGLISDQKLNAGLVSLTDLYAFLESYRVEKGDLDRLYEKNVRQFLKSSRVNPGIKQTLNEDPESFGLYNNGITIVVNDIHPKENDIVELVNPYVVNGCQTTQTIWNVFDRQTGHGGTGNKEKFELWEQRASKGFVVTKIVKIGINDEPILQNFTRYTNKQNSVAGKNFLTLDNHFQNWKRDMAEKYNLFLEVQRGGWDAHQALQRRTGLAKSKKTNFTDHANAFDLIKVFGAG